MWAPGAKFGKYKLVERLGKGGMAETWRGELLAAEGVRKAVVIKRILPSFSDNKEFIEAFVQEAKVTASLSHGNVAQVFDFGQVGDSHFIAMELIDGRSLDRVLKHGIARGYWHMPYPIAALIGLEVAKGLEHVHTRRGPKGPLNIVHRDVSPDNIIVGMSGETKLVDFGVAKSVLAGRKETEAGIIKGKYIYFSPEQASGERVDFRSDIYSLGVVLYRLVTGQKAFDGPGLKVLQQINKGEYTPLRVANPDVPDELATVIETMMAVRKEDRFPSTLELVEALTAALQAMAPRAGVHWIRDWVRWLYTTELKERGEEPELRSGFMSIIEGWKPAPKRAATSEVVSAESRPDEMATIASRREGHRRKATGYGTGPKPIPWTMKRKAFAGLAGAGAMLLLIVFVALTSNRDPNEGESDEARKRRIEEATRLKPLAGPPPTTTPAPKDRAPVPGDDETDNTEPAEKVEDTKAPPPPNDAPRDPPREVVYEAEAAPVTFTLSSHHHVSLESATVMPAEAGSLTGARPVKAPAKPATGWTFGQPATQVDTSEAHDVPALLFTPGRPPELEVIGHAGNAQWTRKDARLALFVGSEIESPTDKVQVSANGNVIERVAVIVVDANDRFTVRDLSARASWKMTLTPRPEGNESPGPVVVYFRGGDAVRIDGRPTLGGYAVLAPGTHKVNGATSAWFTVPTLPSLKVAPMEVTIAK